MSEPVAKGGQAAAAIGLDQRLDDLDRRLRGLESLLAEVRALVGPSGVPMPGGRMLVQTLHGTKYLIDPNDLVMAPQLIVYRQWEPELSALIAGLMTPTTRFVDVGANFGYFTCLAAARIGTGGGGRVWAFEPNPRLAELLEANLAINWSMAPVEVSGVAVGAQSGAAVLSVPRRGAANATLTRLDDDDCERLPVRVAPLDDLLPADAVIDVLKIDVEGHEAGVLEGARRVLARSPGVMIVMEWSKSQIEAAGYAPEKLLNLFAELGFEAGTTPADGRIASILPLSDETLCSTPYANIVLRRRATA